jgi:hypothetical protein
MTVTNRPNRSEKRKKIVKFLDLRERQGTVAVMPRKKSVGDGGSAAQKRALGHCRTQSVLQRRVPHRSHLARPLRRVQLTKTRQPRIGIWLSGKKAMLCAQPRHTLTRCGIHFRSTQMGQCNGFRSRLWQLVRIFTARLVMEK